MGALEAIGIGVGSGGFNLNFGSSFSGLLTIQYISYALYTVVFCFAGYMIFKTLMAPLHINIFEKVGHAGYRWVGKDYGFQLNKDGVISQRWMIRKEVLKWPSNDYLIMKNRWSNVVNYLKVAPGDYRPMSIDASARLIPMSEPEKNWIIQHVKTNLEEKQNSKGILDRPVLNYAIMGMISFLFIVMAMRYASGIVEDANSQSYRLMSESTASSAKATGQIASALSSIQITGVTLPTEVPKNSKG